MFNMLHVITLPGGSEMAECEMITNTLASVGKALPGVRGAVVGSTLPRALNGGSAMWRLSFISEDDCLQAVSSRQWHEGAAPLLSAPGTRIERVAYRQSLSDTSAGRGRAGIWRCLLLSVDVGTPAEMIRRFERDIALMPEHVSTIGNWSLGHVAEHAGSRNWTHVWEQEFDDLAGLEGEYMTSPIHWGLVDGWFDPECPQRIVDTRLIHAAIEINEAVIL